MDTHTHTHSHTRTYTTFEAGCVAYKASVSPVSTKHLMRIFVALICENEVFGIPKRREHNGVCRRVE